MNNETSAGNQAPAEMSADFEKKLRTGLVSGDLKDARFALRRYLWAQVGEQADGTIVEAIERIARDGRRLPNVAAVLLRSLAVDQLLPRGAPGNQVDRSLVTIVETSLPKVCEYVGLDAKSQTFVKLSKLRDTHNRICEILAPLRTEFQTLEGLVSSRQPVTGALNHNSVRAYAEPFRLGAVRGIVDRVFHAAQQVILARPTLLLDVEHLESVINEGLESEAENASFIFYDFLTPFLSRASEALKSFIASARGRFSTRITSVLADDEFLPKRYPLHEVGREIQVRIPLRNSGPGMAIRVRAEVAVMSDSVVLQGPVVMLGDVLPGEFSLSFDAMVVSPLSSFSEAVWKMVEWGIPAG